MDPKSCSNDSNHHNSKRKRNESHTSGHTVGMIGKSLKKKIVFRIILQFNPFFFLKEILLYAIFVLPFNLISLKDRGKYTEMLFLRTESLGTALTHRTEFCYLAPL